jgi:hypothetical protein
MHASLHALYYVERLNAKMHLLEFLTQKNLRKQTLNEHFNTEDIKLPLVINIVYNTDDA